MSFRRPSLILILNFISVPILIRGEFVPRNKSHENPIIAGYFPDYRSYIDVNESTAKLLTDIILFSITPTSDGTVDANGTCCLDNTHYTEVRKAQAFNEGRV